MVVVGVGDTGSVYCVPAHVWCGTAPFKQTPPACHSSIGARPTGSQRNTSRINREDPLPPARHRRTACKQQTRYPPGDRSRGQDIASRSCRTSGHPAGTSTHADNIAAARSPGFRFRPRHYRAASSMKAGFPDARSPGPQVREHPDTVFAADRHGAGKTIAPFLRFRLTPRVAVPISKAFRADSRYTCATPLRGLPVPGSCGLRH